uniref:Putative peptidase n=1 Tax=viral metagenome TaxID=1070528 RepID=A0A6H1Z9X9_9ZZZZ
MNQYGPDGSVEWGESGYKTITDPTSGATYNVPRYTQTTTLSPQQQAIKDQNDAAGLNLSTIANKQSAFLGDYLSKPVNLNNEATEARLMELGRTRLDPMAAQRSEDLRTRLANQGIKAGSDAYGKEMNTFDQGTNDAYTQLMLQGRGQAVQEALTERNQPINEIIGLMGGTQVGVPQFAAGTQQPQLPTVDYAGLVNENYNQQLGVYNQKMQAQQGILGGLFGLGGKLIGLSDERAKKNIKPVGELMGHKLYDYRYKGKFDDGKRHIGVMAQQAEKKDPGAVTTRPDGLKQVNYGRLFGMGTGVAA